MVHKNLFEIHAVDNENDIPIVLIDKSASTKSEMKTGKTILNTFSEVVIKHVNRPHHLLFWSVKSEIISDIIDNNSINETIDRVKSSGGTDVSAAFHNIPKEWLERCNNIYILTDGDVNEDKHDFNLQVRQLTKFHPNIKLHIFSVEENEDNYLVEQYYAGNKIYKMIKENKLTHYVKNFISYNNFHKIQDGNYYRNLYNPDIKEGYIPYENRIFPVTKTSQFLQYMASLIDIYANDQNEVNKIIHNLTITIHHLTKNKPVKIQNDVIDMFCNLFSKTNVSYSELKELLTQELSNHQTNRTSTLQDYIKNRNKLFEKADKSLQDDCLNSISYCKQLSYITLPVLTDVGLTIFENNSDTESVKMRMSEYKNGGIKIGDHVIPAFPSKVVQSLFTNQCLRQWLRAILSTLYSKTTNSDIILYKFLAMALKINLSDVSDHIKKAYVMMSYVMLDRKRYQCGIKEIDHLLAGNPPLPVFDSFDKMNDILKECSIEFNVEPYTFWYAIIAMLDNEDLLYNQQIYCKEALDTDKMTFDNILDELKNKHKPEIKHIKLNVDELEYYCYVSLEDTSDIGGFKIPQHHIGEYICNPKYVITEESYDHLKTQNLTCPICHTNIAEFEKVGPKIQSVVQNYEILSNVFNNHKIIAIDDLDYDDTILDMNDLDFETGSFDINVPHLVSKMNPHLMVHSTTQDFIKQVSISNYNFVLEMDFTNMIIAGGFCKSILLDQEVNDLDLFFYGLSAQEIMDKLKMTVNWIMEKLDGKFMVLHKKNTNVFELLRYVMNGTEKKATHKIQLILVQNQDLKSIFDKFDLDSCRVAFDGENVYFNKSSHVSYKYMINVINEKMYTDTYDLRLKKYFDNGFAIVAPELNLSGNRLKLGYCDIKGYHDNDFKFVVENFMVNFQDCKITGNTKLYNGVLNKKLYNSTTDDIDNKSDNLIDQTLEYIKKINEKESVIDHSIVDEDDVLPNAFYKNVIVVPKIDKAKYVDWYKSHRKSHYDFVGEEFAECDESI